jgi:hypothetical protein
VEPIVVRREVRRSLFPASPPDLHFQSSSVDNVSSFFVVGLPLEAGQVGYGCSSFVGKGDLNGVCNSEVLRR